MGGFSAVIARVSCRYVRLLEPQPHTFWVAEFLVATPSCSRRRYDNVVPYWLKLTRIANTFVGDQPTDERN